MGRSVDYLSNATRVAYMSYESTYTDEDGNECEDEFAFDDLYGNTVCTLKAKYPSLEIVENEYDGNETKIVLESKLVEFGISEYCGLVSLSARPNERYEEYRGLAEAWINKNWDAIESKLSEFSDVLHKQGTMSNGCGVFKRRES